MIKIPYQLRNPDFRFFLIGKDVKVPLQKSWNRDNCFPFFHSVFATYIGNYGVACGYSGLVVLDFDDRTYYEQKIKELPKTFVVRTALKKLYHVYLILDGEMFKKVGIDLYESSEFFKGFMTEEQLSKFTDSDRLKKYLNEGTVKKVRVCDIQAEGAGVVGPNSSIGRKYYDVVVDVPIAHITTASLQAIFPFKAQKKVWMEKTTEEHPEAVKNVLTVLQHLKIEQTGERHFNCPFHVSSGKHCLWVTPEAGLFCFHCNKRYSDIHSFVDDVIFWRETHEMGKKVLNVQ